MKKLRILKDTNPSLRKKSVEVKLPLSQEDKDTLLAMNEWLRLSQDDEYAEKHNMKAGVGMAAPQVGVNKRMFVIYFQNNDGTYTNYILVNPRIIEQSAKMAALNGGEGCLSVDNPHQGLVHRHNKIKLVAYNLLSDKEETITAEGYEAIVLQHEYDHLDGILFYDRIDPFQPNNPKPGEKII